MFVDVLPTVGIGSGEKALLTYRTPLSLSRGALVIVPFRNRKVPALVMRTYMKPAPSFKVYDIVRVICSLHLLPSSSEQLLHWMAEACITPPGQVARLFLPSWLVRETEIPRVPIGKHPKRRNSSGPIFSFGEEEKIYDALRRLAQQNKKQVLVLAPTNEKARNIAAALKDLQPMLYFGGARQHNRQLWFRARAGSRMLVIGTRAALFLPFGKLDLVAVLDETSPFYFQELSQPRFHVPEVARFLANISGARLFLSGTLPLLDTWYRAKQQINVVPPKRSTKTISLRKRKRLNILPEETAAAIAQTLGAKGKTLVFAARRGEAPVIACRDCGSVLLCPHCETPMPAFRVQGTGNSQMMVLRCRHCGEEMRMALACPSCRSLRLSSRGIAAQALVSELKNRFPKANIFELSADATPNEHGQKRTLNAFSDAAGGILVATHMLFAKTLPPIDLCVIASVDQLLTIPDFRAEERLFEMITRLKGLLSQQGELIIQSWNPHNPLLQKAASGDWKDFIREELALRKSFAWPPFMRLAKLTYAHRNAETADAAVKQFIEKLQKTLSLNRYPLYAEVLGPSPGLVPRPRGKYVRIILVKWKPKNDFDTSMEEKLSHIVPARWDVTVNPSSIL